MVPKNNQWQHLQTSTQRVSHYGLRKLSVGVASVLLSTTLYMGVSAHADTLVAPSGTSMPTTAVTGSGSAGTETGPSSSATETASGAPVSQATVEKPMVGMSTGNATADGQPASTATDISTGNVATDAQLIAYQSTSTVASSLASEINANSKPVQTVSPKQSADTTGVQSIFVQSEKAAVNSNASRNDVSAASTSTVLSKQSVNTVDGVQSFVNLAVESDNNDLTPKDEVVDSKWTLHYVNQADHQQELKAPTVITMQYARTNIPQSDGTTQYGDWSYVPGSFKQTGTPITVKDSDDPVRQDNVDKNGGNMDVFTITAMYPTITGYDFHNGIGGARLRDNLRNNERQADSMSKDFYAEYDVAKERSVTVKFVDDQSSQRQIGQAITLTGRDGDTVDLNLTVPDKYQLANGQQLPDAYTFTEGSGDLIIHLVHQVVQREAAVDVQLELMTAVRIYSDQEALFTVTQVHWKQLAAEINNGNSPDTPNQLVKIGTLKGHVGYDLVDKEIVSFGDDWTGLKLGDQTYQLPNGDEVVNGVMASFNDDSWGKTLKEYFLKDKPNIDSDYINLPWHGYLSVNATNNDDSLEIEAVHEFGLQTGLAGNEPNALAKATDDRAATAVEMVNKTIVLNWLQDMGLSSRKLNEQDGQLKGKAVLPVAGVYIPYVEKTITRTIKITMPDGKTTTVTQTATLAKQVDLEENDHPEWTTGKWANYDVPTISGYTPSQPNVAQQTVTDMTKDQTVNITYTLNEQQISIEYVDDVTGQIVKTDHMSGKVGQTVSITPSAPANYDLVDGSNRTYTVTSADGQTFQIYVKHHQVTTTESKTVTRAINIHTPHDGMKTVKQMVTLNREVTTDQVTGEKTYGDWTTGQWEAYTPEAIPGYMPSINEVPKVSVDDRSSDQMVDVTYTSNTQTVVITFMDPSGNTIGTPVTVSGRIGETVNINDQVPDGWKLYAGQTVPNAITLGLGSTEYDFVINHLQKFISFDQPKVMTDLVEGTRNIYYPSGLTRHDLTKTITRTIKDGDRVVKTQLVTFVRNAVVDAVTGRVTYLNWSYNGQYLFTAYVPTSKDGYTVDFVKSLVVTPDSKSSVADLVYQPVVKTINYVDASGKVIQSITGVTKLAVPAGYRLMTSDPINVGDLAVNTYNVLVEPAFKTYTVHDQLPTNVKDLRKVITRTVRIEMPNGHLRIVKQQVKFERTATVDANGIVTYSDYHAIDRNSFNKVFIPHRVGYKLIFSDGSNGVVKVDNVKADTSDTTIVVKYVK